MRHWHSLGVAATFLLSCAAAMAAYWYFFGHAAAWAVHRTVVALSSVTALLAAWAIYASRKRLTAVTSGEPKPAPGRKGIAWQLTSLVAVVAVPLIALVVYFAVSEARRSTVTQASHSSELARLKAEELGRVMRDLEASLANMARREIVLLVNAARCDPLMSRFSDVAQVTQTPVVRGMDGAAVCPPAPPGKAHRNYGDSEWYAPFVRGKTFRYSDPHIGPVSGEWIIEIMLPLRRGGEPVGSIDVGVSLARLAQTLTVGDEADAVYVLFDDVGTVIASSSPETYRFGESGRALPIIKPHVERASPEVRTLDRVGEDMVVAYHRVVGTPWVMAAALPAREVFAAKFMHSLLLLLPMLGLSYAAASYIAYRILRPIRELTESARRIAAGDVSERVAERGGSEVRTLARAINSMLDARERTLSALVESERRFKGAMFVAAPLYWEQDAGGRFTTALVGREGRASGIVTPELVGQFAWDLAGVNPDAPVWKELKEKIRRHEAYSDVEFTLEPPNSDPLVIATTGEPVHDAQGHVIGWRGVLRNVTARARATQALRLYEAAISATSDGMVITTADINLPGPQILYANRAFCEMAGYNASELLGQTPRLFQGPLTDRSALDRVRAALRAGEPVRAETVNYRKDGSAYDVAWSLAPLKDLNGKLTYWIGSMRDVTQVKSQARQLAQNALELEERVAERTAVLTTTAKELQAFTYSVSHDLRAPLRVMEGFAEILSEDYSKQLDAVGQDHVKRIRAAAKRMNGMIDSLLELSRTAMADLRREDIDLSQLAKEVFVDCTAHSAPRHIEFDVEEGLVVNADRALIRNVLDNLIGNAIKFTSKRSDSRVAVGREWLHGRYAYFVRDNGAGFDMRFAQRLFGAFQRLHSTADYPGTGVGLASVQRIVRRHGGRIWAESEPGRGATFYFTLDGEGDPSAAPANANP